MSPSLLPSPSRELRGFAKRLAGVRTEPTMWLDLSLNSVLFDQPFLRILTTCQVYAKCWKNRNKWGLASVCGSCFSREHRCGVMTLRSLVRVTERCGNVPAGPSPHPFLCTCWYRAEDATPHLFHLDDSPADLPSPIPRSSSLESFPDTLPSNLFSQNPTLNCWFACPVHHFLTLGYV